MISTWVWPSVSGRPPMSESRPKETSFGRGRGRAEVSSLGGGEERGEDEGEGPPSGREDDMMAQVAVAVGRVLAMACVGRRGQPWWLAARCKGRRDCDWQERGWVSARFNGGEMW
jgi:hypothetical protein